VARALVVDDSRVGRLIVARMIRNAGWAVVEADSGPSAMQVIAEATPDIIFLDLHMPGMGGQDVIRRIRSLGYSVPIVVLTADAQAETREACARLGVQAYLNKPVRQAMISELLASTPAVPS
jgi:CheY-like chemotaxis protein